MVTDWTLQEKYDEIAELFVNWNEKRIDDGVFARSMVNVLESDYQKASDRVMGEGEEDDEPI